MAIPPTDPRVDELRQRLRALGYLDGGVDRFVLGPARGRRGPVTIALLASLRVGIIAALLLGPAAAIGVGGRLPGLITGARDAGVIALYMGALFGAAATIGTCVVSLAVSAVARERAARRAKPLSLAAGGAVAVASLFYLTLWWRTANAGFGWSAPVWTAFALVVAVAISLLLAHAVRVTALAVMLSGHQNSDSISTNRSTSSWQMSLGAGVLAFAGAATLLVVTAPDKTRGTNPAITVVSTGLRLRVIAIDGFDAGIFEHLAGAGRLPALHAALSPTRGRLAPEATRDPARVWTTIATGQPPERHGVRGLEMRRVAGIQGTLSKEASSPLADALRGATDLVRLTRPAITSGTERREKTFWEVASDAGLRTVVVNWWATWPAPDAGGADGPIVLTDRAILRLERGGALDAEIAPGALYERLRANWAALRAGAVARAAQSLGPVPVAADVRAILLRSAELDALQLALAREVSGHSTDLVAIYLPGLDIAQHALLAPGEGAPSPSSVAARLDALREYYVCLDRLLGDALHHEADELVVVVAQPGRVEATADGLIGLSGPAARPDATQSGRSLDVAPTVLHALGLPISHTFAGAPLTMLMADDFVRRHPVRVVATYGPPSARHAGRSGQPLDQEAIDRLRSLGYVR